MKEKVILILTHGKSILHYYVSENGCFRQSHHSESAEHGSRFQQPLLLTYTFHVSRRPELWKKGVLELNIKYTHVFYGFRNLFWEKFNNYLLRNSRVY